MQRCSWFIKLADLLSPVRFVLVDVLSIAPEALAAQDNREFQLEALLVHSLALAVLARESSFETTLGCAAHLGWYYSVSTTISSVSTSGQTVSTGPSTSISTSAVIPSTSTSSTSGYTYGTATSTTAPSVSSSQYPSSSSSGSLSLPATTTAPGTTASSTGTSSTAGQTQLILARPTPIITNLDLATYYQGDDEALEVTLPFAMELFGSVSSNIYVSTNGVSLFLWVQVAACRLKWCKAPHVRYRID